MFFPGLAERPRGLRTRRPLESLVLVTEPEAEEDTEAEAEADRRAEARRGRTGVGI